MADTVPREWQCPRAESSESHKLGWLNESVEQGGAWVESQRGADDWRKSLDILSGNDSRRSLLSERSLLSGHRLKTNIRTSTAGLANIRPFWGYNAGDTFKQYAQALNKTTRALYLENYWDQTIKDLLSLSAATCSSYARPVYRRNMQGVGNIEIDTFAQPCVLPVQMPANGDLQRAYVVNLLEEVPIYEAHWRFPLFQDRLRPTTSRYWYAAQIRQSSRQNAAKRLIEWFRRPKEADKLRAELIPLRWSTINDCAINDTGVTIPMGEAGTSWHYEVPSYGTEIPDGFDYQGNPKTRTADENDARLYPNRRLMISSEECVMYDGPAFNWHGQVDLIQFYMDRWPWEPIGFSMVRDGYDLQKAIDTIDRMSMDKVRAQRDPPLAYPLGAVSPNEAESFDPYEQNQRIGYDEQSVDEPFKLAVPLEVFKLQPEVAQLRQVFQEELDYTLQTRDIVELNKARALGKNVDSIEAMVSAQGPIVKDIARGLEKSLGQLGHQLGYLVLQYMTSSRVMQWVGAENMALSVFDYDPSSIIPSHWEDENPHGPDPSIPASGGEPSPDTTPVKSRYTKMQRAKMFAKRIRFFVLPHSLHEITQMSMRLMLMQLRQRGYPVSAATVMESCEVPDVGKPDGLTEQDRFWTEKEDEISHQLRIAKITQTEMAEQGIQPPDPAKGKGGRPSTDQKAPHHETKGNGRPVVSSSP